ncbi:hypothetical protein Y1Q_0022547 [Alligator mississippiensis]|uniref:Uncharacterized protein n=1 Tax=Alligator mississippiensis TaxID=8496 RepID=A0A151NW58_ALLMI|nr:hypothetical protein Y1Q_0022547 [Alligator mississippiensis]
MSARSMSSGPMEGIEGVKVLSVYVSMTQTKTDSLASTCIRNPNEQQPGRNSDAGSAIPELPEPAYW